MGRTEQLLRGSYEPETRRIIGEKLILQPITAADTDRIINWRNQEHVRRNFIYQQPFTREGHERWLKEMIETGRAVQFIMYEKEAGDRLGRPVGSCYLRDIDYESAKAEYGMYLGDEAARSRGYGTEAAMYAAEYAFRVLKLHKVFSRIFSENIPSIRSCEKAGMQREAYLKDEVKINNRFYDIVFVAKIKGGREF